ncbi:DUF6379 domain-containing protein [Leifsonia sp. NPDC058194]|uniref:C-glycoside deglycosidase beta subunit domain-containing protein n=1 Tax=Leifsonia sp. NPDC058194 TaxID=3346374 RepID=UPI0036D875DA
MLPDRIIEQGTLEKRGARAAISVRIPWYRALPLSSITGVEFAIDGHDIERDSLTWTVNGTTYTLDELPPRFDEWWYVLDSAVIEGDWPEAVAVKGEHTVRAKVGLYIPYLPAGPGFIAIGEQDIKTMPVKEGVTA